MEKVLGSGLWDSVSEVVELGLVLEVVSLVSVLVFVMEGPLL